MILRVLKKLFIYPIKYFNWLSYNKEKYWSERFERYDGSIVGPGNESISEEENIALYKKSAERLSEVILAENAQMDTVAEIGAGNGYFTKLYSGYTENITCIDITDANFEMIKDISPNIKTIKHDITEQLVCLNEVYDSIFLIDVIQHIVTKKELIVAIDNIKKMVKPNGKIFIGPLLKKDKRQLLYVKTWSAGTVKEMFGDCMFSEHEFKNGTMLVVTSKQKSS